MPTQTSDRTEDLAHLIAGPHHLAARLDSNWRNRRHTKLIGKHVKRALETPGSRTAVITPPQIGKSSLCAIWAPFWGLMCDPTKKIITTSYGQHLANRNGRAIRNLVRDHGHRFGRALASDARSVSEWYTSAGGGVKSAGVGSGITGFSANALFIDDIYKNRADAESHLVRETIWEWLSSSALTRLSPAAPVFMIGTLWTEQDPILRLIDQEGRLEDGGRWRIIHLPALAEHSLTRGTDPLGRADGDPLTHPLIDDGDREALLKHWHDKKSSVLPRDWIALYQGDPHPREGALVSWDVINGAVVPHDKVPEPTRTVTAVDPAGGGDDEVGIVTAVTDAKGVCYVIDDHASGVMPVTEWPRRVCDEVDKHDSDRIVLEANFGGRLVENAIRSAWGSQERSRNLPPITTVRALKGKALRAEPIAQEMAQGRVKIKAGLDKLMRQWCVAGGELVTAERGDVPIQDIRVGDRVWTRSGWREVQWSGCTGIRKTLTLIVDGGMRVRCTPDHLVWVEGRGWVEAQTVHPLDRVQVCLGQRTVSITMESPTRSVRMAPIKRAERTEVASCIESSGQSGTVRSLLGSGSLMPMATSQTIESKTFGVARELGTGKSLLRSVSIRSSWGSVTTETMTVTTKRPAAPLPGLGIDSSTEPCGQPTMDQFQTERTSTTSTETLLTTISPTFNPWMPSITSVTTRELPQVVLSPGTLKQNPRPDGKSGQREKLSGGRALSVESISRREDHERSTVRSPVSGQDVGEESEQDRTSSRANTVASKGTHDNRQRNSVQTAVRTVLAVREDADPVRVYDITVEEAHEFFAGGILVHNCSYRPGSTDSPGRLDASVYAAVELLRTPNMDHLMSAERGPRRREQVQARGRRLPGR